ncbi:MAG: transglutaminase-like domain-containing protein [Bacteroidetes bacterium]|nr:transglutaminase-like domain-containing protein [Bacteroidota bacterium]
MNPQALLTLLDDPDPVVEKEILNYFTINNRYEDLVQLEVIRKLVPEERKPFFDNLYSLCKSNWFLINLNAFLEADSLLNLDLLTDVLLGMNVLFDVQHSVMDGRIALENLTEDVREVLHPHDDVVDKLSALNNVIFFKHKFKGNHNKYYLPENSDLSSLLENKTGIPVTLSLMYYLIARRCGIDIHPAALPRHFMLFVSDPNFLFIDCFNSGNILQPTDVADFLVQINVSEGINTYLYPSGRAVMKRILQNLVYIYSNGDQHEKLTVIENLIKKVDSFDQP